jgi:exopolysaccharide biosynthesis polyprenyl glycosylphosphotransferase
MEGIFKQAGNLLKASFLSGVLVLAFFYYIRSEPYSRKLLALFIPMLFLGLSFSHLCVMVTLRSLRKKGYNLRYYAVIGAGKKGQQLVQDIESMGWLGLKCAFFVDDNPGLIGTELLGTPVYGPIMRVPEMVEAKNVDEVYLALGGDEAQRAYPILESLQYSGVTIRIIPNWGNLISMSEPAVMTIGSQLLFSAADSPLSGYKIILKQLFDFAVALLMLIVLSIPMLVIALLIKLTSKGPVFYRQSRVGMDRKEFQILKFRTMKEGAEKESCPQWSRPNDSRCTSIGAWLRRTSLDEIPQLINVVKGQMSLVGPRPERPVFVKQFFEEHRKYMLRHKVKAGMTGWAQIHGFRGDTSLRKRLVYDLYYVRNWSFGLDLWILLRTPWHIIKGKNAY